ncbi:MAG: MoaD/ThiS family protein [Paracoccaceae bacterium]|jgi:molybdopterin synthase sulfur carrier subunit|nr:MoaD/ThiS family protein [Paracoccaceae bacterium]PQM56856.1 MAG: molybdopterin synthase sulfur carrier subunit [Paracoccaceae bacterium]|tara:strand:+ start:634 stop:882 length:249 start_codon:yes stop_codon:yes gene_type:complete
MKILYFAWLREKIGVSFEEKEIKAVTVIGLIEELVLLDEKYSIAFSDLSFIRVAVDQKLIQDFKTSIKDAKEIAFFPPMTGG